MARARAGTRPSRILTRATKLGIVVVALFAAAIFLLSRGDERTDQPDVVLVGDSFAEQSADQFLSFARGEGLHAEVFAFGGSSICSWEGQLTELVEREPKVLVLSFAGNDVHPCINPDSIPNRSPEEVADLYRNQLDVVARQYREAGSRIYVVAPPPVKKPLFEGYAAAMRRMYAEYADDHPEITVVETFEGLGPDGEYHKSLPCEEGEPCGPDGMVVLRQDDDIHLTPEGGKRYARMIMEALEDDST